MFVQDGFLYLIVTKHKLTVYGCYTTFLLLWHAVKRGLLWQQQRLTLSLSCCSILLRRSCCVTAGYLVLSAVAAFYEKVNFCDNSRVLDVVSLHALFVTAGWIIGLLWQHLGIWYCLITGLLMHHAVTTG